ncbi:hypothetical protein [Saccharopolyspora sp. SCSIO 74807]|uniref:hypothetical protein n=1 Tax=Saccharopolyspora sp. SCSIO 74807 TaxID=3118084 RepID=UPI0030CFD1E4
MPRTDTIARAFLNYLYDEDDFRPEVAGFLASAHAGSVIPPPQRAELVEVVRLLQTRELVATGRESAEGLPLRAGLTGSGLICVSDHGGDVASWDGAAPVAVAEPPEVVPPRSPAEPPTVPRESLEGIARVARVALLALPTVHARYGEAEAVQRVANGLWEATRAPRPDPRRVRLLAAKLRSELGTGSMANTLGVVLMDSLDEALREAQLP